MIIRDVYSAIPAAGIPGRLFFADDTNQAYRDNGSTWDLVLIGGGGAVSSVATTLPIIGGTITTTGTIGVNNATSSTVGVVKPDNTTITISSGVISAVSSAPSFVDNEIISFTGTSGTLANTPVTGSEHLYKNGQRLIPGSPSPFSYDYSVSGAVITLAIVALVSDQFVCDYRK
jgi:hypothetical protein